MFIKTYDFGQNHVRICIFADIYHKPGITLPINALMGVYVGFEIMLENQRLKFRMK